MLKVLKTVIGVNTIDNGGRRQKNIKSRVTRGYLAKGHPDLLVSNP